jgi:hypothetical protein
LLRSKVTANNSASAANMRTMNTAQYAYAVTYPHVGFSGTWPPLGPAPPGAPCGVNSACLLDSVIACASPQGPCTKSGYNYFINDGTGGPGVGTNPAPGVAPNSNYAVSGTPVKVGITGDQNFCSTGAAIVASSTNATPPPPSPPQPLSAPGETAAGCLVASSYGPIH